MTNINSAAYLAALMQAQMGHGLQRRDKSGESKGHDAASKKAETSIPAQRDSEELGTVSSEVLTQIRTLSNLDPKLKRLAFRVFLQAKLAQQLDVAASQDSTFNQLVDEVLVAMEADADLNAALLTAGQRLLDLALER